MGISMFARMFAVSDSSAIDEAGSEEARFEASIGMSLSSADATMAMARSALAVGVEELLRLCFMRTKKSMC